MTLAIVASASEAELKVAQLEREVARLEAAVDRANDRQQEAERERDDVQHELDKLQNEQAATNARPFRPDAKRIDSGDWIRACSTSVCECCGYQYWEHATVQGFEWMHRLCDGRFVKL